MEDNFRIENNTLIMIYVIKKYVTLIGLLFSMQILYAQKTITLSKQINTAQNHTYVARDNIIFAQGSAFSAYDANKSIHAYIDENIIVNAAYQTPKNPNTQTTNTDLSVGITTGYADVSPSGAAVYSIPFFAPLGTNGMQPSIGIAYNSQVANGILGVGWNITGLSTITRTGKTIHHDGKVEGIVFDNSDNFMLDGQRLISVGTKDNNGWQTEYRTEIESFAKIYINGWNQTQMITSFTVEHKNGLMYEYGKTDDSRIEAPGRTSNLNDPTVAYAYALNRIKDPHGNEIHFKYIEDRATGEFNIKEITYAGNSIMFFYEKRGDVSSAYITGSRIEQTMLLYKVKILNQNKLVKSYEFKYAQAGFDNKSHLNEIIEYASNGERLNSTIVGWGNAGALINTAPINEIDAEHQIYTGDFNGDGIMDLAVVTSNRELWYGEGRPSGVFKFSEVYKLPSNYDKDIYKIITADLNGDNRTDIVYATIESSKDEIIFYTLLSNKNGITGENACALWKDNLYRKPLVGDFDGDGVDEILLIPSEGNGTYSFLTLHGKIDFLSNASLEITEEKEALHTYVIDFNGNGKKDIMVLRTDKCEIYEISNESITPNITFKKLVSTGYPTYWHKVFFGDFNGDGNTDVLTWVSGYGWEVHQSKGKSGWDWGVVSKPLLIDKDPTESSNKNSIFIGDFNGDGKSDILELIQSESDSLMFIVNVNYSKNGTFYKQSSVHAGMHVSKNPNTYQTPPADFNGNGKSDFLLQGGLYRNNKQLLSFYKDEELHIVTSIFDGINNISFNYALLTENKATYTKGYNSVMPYKDFSGPLKVIASVQYSGMQPVNYYYKEAIMHHNKGFLGFKEISQQNTLDNSKTVSTFTINTLYATMNLRQSKQYIGNTLISQTTYINNIHSTCNDKILFPYVTEVKTEDFINNTESIKTIAYLDLDKGLVDNVKTKIGIKGSVNAQDFVQEKYENYIQAGSWMLSKPQKTTIIKSRESDPTDYVRTTNYTYTNKGQVETIISDNGVTVTNTYNNKGNLTQKRISGTDFSSRTESYAYDSWGRYIISKTNVLNQKSYFEYDPLFGNIIKSTGVDNLSVVHEYDDWGNRIQTIMPNGEIITYSTGWESSDKGLFYTYVKVPNSQNTKQYFDNFGRVVLVETQKTGGTVLQKAKYNSKGQLEMSSLPYSYGAIPIWNKTNYDIYGRVISEISNVNEAGTATPLSLTTNYSYSTNALRVIDGFGNVAKKTYNHFGEVIESEDNGGRIGHTYYSSGLPKSVVYKTPGGAVQADTEITMEYDNFGNQTVLNDPSAGKIEYQYNSLGQLINQKDARDNEYSMQYDILGRLMSKTVPEGVYAYSYNNSANGINQLKSVVAPNNTSTVYKYDSYGRVVKQIENIDDEEFTYQFEYDNTYLRRMLYPSGFAIKFLYDAYGTHTATTDDANKAIWTLKSLHTLGGIRAYTLGNGLTTTHTYDADYGTLVGIQTGAVQQIEFDFKNTDNKLQQNLQSRTSFGMQETFAYDKANRLTRSQVEQHTPILVEYADNGNITYKSNVGTYSYENSSGEQALPYSVKGIQTPAHGVQQIERLELSYTPHKKIAQILQTKGNKMAEFTYGANEQRVKMVLKEHNKPYKTKYYVGAYEKEIMPNGSTRELHYIDGVGIYVQSSSGVQEMYYTHKDHLGSITEITDSQGAVVERLSYDAWGNRRNSHTWDYDSDGDNFLFDRGYTGHEHLDDFAIINMNGRIYDPLTGRMMAPDNYVQSSLSQNLNRYSYCLNNPLIYTDPSGDLVWFVPVIIGAAIGGASGYMIGQANGASGWNMVGYIAGGALIGGLSGGAAVGISAVGGGAMLAGAGAGAISGAGFNGLATNWDSQTMLKGAAFGAISGFVGGGVGAAIGGGAGAFAGGASANLTNQLLYSKGDFNQVNLSSVALSGVISLG
ncbi:MAG: FG-GAP-like repeat-containing protein, partial [Bacteroidales bacterium]|nr:FG-GAP-like repeat-containing protein [Bacteroidales bacterium]